MLTKGTLISGETLPSDTDHAQNSTKSAISGLDDLFGDGFVVWAQWTKDPEDNAQFTGEYSSGSTDLVFGQNGTKVYYPDWNYSPRRFWHRGSYVFAAALPASFFNASHAKTEDELEGQAISGVFSGNSLTLNFGKDSEGNDLGLDLAESQADLMFALDEVDNRKEDATELTTGVDIDFKQHQFVQIVIQAASADENADIVIEEVTFYGNHRATAGPMTVYFEEEGIRTDYELDATTITDSENPYIVVSDIATRVPKAVPDSDGNLQYTYDDIVSGLLVFPEECQMSLIVRYRSAMGDDVSETLIEGTVTTPDAVTWVAGQKYVYKLNISAHRIGIVSSSIMDWNELDINHDFN